MPTRFNRVYIEAAGYHLPGPAISNEAMDAYIAPLNRISGRIKARILAENGIATRHYGIDAEGNTVISHAQLAAAAVHDCLARAQAGLGDVSLLSVGSSGGDALMPGFANMIQGELGAPPMSTLSSQGVCAAGVSAIQHAAQGIELGAHRQALALAAEMPSRMFKRSRFGPRGYDSDFDAHFLRWMLSDGAGALLLTDSPSGRGGLRLKLNWIHQQSFAGDYPVCMQLGLSQDRSTSFLDYPSASEAEAAGALSLRQDIRLLPHLFDVSIHEYVKLVEAGWVKAGEVDHFLCHYSSEKFIPVVEELLDKAGLSIARERWYSNLRTRGNTGAASIFIMLAEFLDTHSLKAGEKILCFIPESGRISAAYMLLEVEDASAPLAQPTTTPAATRPGAPATAIAAPHDPAGAPSQLQPLLTQLAGIWHDYRSAVWRSPVIHKLVAGQFSVADYQRWTAQWVPQVREGSKWMREAVASLTGPFAELGALIETHAGDEQNDFMILYQDYQAAGGTQPLDALRRNPGGEALNSYLHALAASENPLGLLGAIYVIEGTGQRIVPALLPLLRQQVDLPPSAFRFLDYHGANDEHHLARWLAAVEIVLSIEPKAAEAILATARRTTQLYLMQFEHILDA
ncbi:StlD/DarB family beta-ketosynthase [Chitinimonas taiwanensis]|uniref:3-oxoacyl-[acyl-carrier-protein] synthase-3 n=1 Tax=Chitinimonas taiwanensis DSM 18899 TaxID=1121279 RepID=A0A1K2H7V1_9NEIS|nr:StlD/DarB family beta-ketosynthase [Chitinimonas taiwanensis]SFZ72178.1 3-oxoacyl-[acyl-carrier-protein] synthase-3 [Chitinimonas taiwanensis DSM 18899]